MTGFMRNLFGPYQLYDTPDHEDLVPKLLFVEKWAIYGSGFLSLFEVLLTPKPPKGFFAKSRVVMKYVAPVAVAGGTFVGTLFASAQLRGKKDDEWNSFNATITSGAMYHYLLKGSPYTFITYFMYVGFVTNVWKQAKLNGWGFDDYEKQMEQRQYGFTSGPYLFDWSLSKEYPPKWVNADDLTEEERAKVKIAT
uniref:NADH dehydrogenase [ubiquinone] 1 alpha subcomplex subunit 11 n=1 Tax=Cacopsylla melanoneura TaxID=428564 RepID=A0A8D8XRX9_9HEMI